MTFLDRLFGRRRDDAGDVPDATAARYRRENAARLETARSDAMTDDERAIERYRYLLRTAPPETIEDAHAEAFAQLRPEQRQVVLQELSREVPDRELAAANADDPRALARAATRAELRRPGTLERTFSSPALGYGAGGIGLGGLMAGGFLSSIAGVVIGTAIADAFFLDSGFDQAVSEGFGGTDIDASTLGTDVGDPGTDIGGDLGTDLGGDFGGEF